MSGDCPAAGSVVIVRAKKGERTRYGFWVTVWDEGRLVHELRSHTTFAEPGRAQERLNEVLQILNAKAQP